MVAYVVIFLNVDPVGQEHGRSISPHGGREAEDSKGRARATAVIKCNILTKKLERALTDRFTDLRLLEKKRAGPNLLYEMKNPKDLISHVTPMLSKAVPRYSETSSLD